MTDKERVEALANIYTSDTTALITLIKELEAENKEVHDTNTLLAVEVKRIENDRLMADTFLDAANDDIKRLEEETVELANAPYCGDCNDTGLLNNRIDGSYPCTCVTETLAYKFIQKEMKEKCEAVANNYCKCADLVHCYACAIQQDIRNLPEGDE